MRLNSAIPRRIRRALARMGMVGVVVLAMPAAAGAQFAPVFNDYKGDQAISACSWAPGVLRGALGQTPPDIAQYAPGFIDAVNGALYTHAQGGCAGQAPTQQAEQGGGAPPGLVDPGPTPKPPAVVKADPILARAPPPSLEPVGDLGHSTPWPPLALASLAALTLLAGGFALLRQYRPAGVQAAGLPAAPGGRLLDLAAGLLDRIRLGR